MRKKGVASESLFICNSESLYNKFFFKELSFFPQPPRLTPQSQRMAQQQQQQRAVAMKRKLETASPTPQQPAKRQQQQQAVPTRTTRSSAAAHKDEYEPETKQPTTDPAQVCFRNVALVFT